VYSSATHVSSTRVACRRSTVMPSRCWRGHARIIGGGLYIALCVSESSVRARLAFDCSEFSSFDPCSGGSRHARVNHCEAPCLFFEHKTYFHCSMYSAPSAGSMLGTAWSHHPRDLATATSFATARTKKLFILFTNATRLITSISRVPRHQTHLSRHRAWALIVVMDPAYEMKDMT
jgi:hypothetical protein